MHARQPSRLQPAAAGPIAIQLGLRYRTCFGTFAFGNRLKTPSLHPRRRRFPPKIPSSRARDPGQAKSKCWKPRSGPTSSRSRKRLLFGGAIACAAAMLAIVLLRPRPIPSLQRADPPVQQVAAESAEGFPGSAQDSHGRLRDGCQKDVGTLRFLITSARTRSKGLARKVHRRRRQCFHC